MNQSKTYQSNIFRQIKYTLLLTIVFANYYLYAPSQELNIYNNPTQVSRTASYTLTPTANYKKRFRRAITEWSLAQLLPLATNRYIRHETSAKLSFESIRNNFKNGRMEWDDNNFFNNQFGHPYQGSLYFNSFRTNGYNFWESIPAVLAGTFIWETICETHPPAPNDLINTSLGGIALGEMSNRLSKIILRKKPGKLKGIIREPIAFIINPMGTLNRVIDHKGRYTAQPGDVDYTNVSIVADAGKRYISVRGKSDPGTFRQEVFGRIHLQYGDPFKDFKEPFSNFSLIAEMGNSDSAIANKLQVEGCIYGRKIKQSAKSDHIFNISLNYDLLNNSNFVFGAQSFAANWLSLFNISKNLQIQLKAGAGIIALAAVSNPYLYLAHGRNYDYGSGVQVKAGTGINIANKVFYNFNFTCGEVITVNGYKSTHSFYTTNSSLRLIIYKGLSFNATSNNYFFKANYKDYVDVKDHHLFRYFSIGYIFKL